MDRLNTINIVEADREHLDTLTVLFDAYRVFYEMESDTRGARSYLEERLRNRDSVIFLALSVGKGVGFTQLYPTFESLQMKPLWVLYDIYVIPACRRQGVARALMIHAQNFARASGAVGMTLATAISNKPAQALYESLGWVRDEDFFYYDLMF
jgi:ribosomal protein S18 acetylase RimI-like enzyme